MLSFKMTLIMRPSTPRGLKPPQITGKGPNMRSNRLQEREPPLQDIKPKKFSKKTRIYLRYQLLANIFPFPRLENSKGRWEKEIKTQSMPISRRRSQEQAPITLRPKGTENKKIGHLSPLQKGTINVTLRTILELENIT